MNKPFYFRVAFFPLVVAAFACLASAQQSPTPPPAKDPYVLEDGGLYIEPIYWLNKAQPSLRGGKTAVAPGAFDYQGSAKAAIGAEIGFPAGRSNTLRLTYLRIQGNTGETLTKDSTIFSQGYLAGDFINATYKTQAIKVSWDYLSYTWHKPRAALHLKTLYEVQYITTKINTAAPFKASTSSSTATNDNTASGSKSVVLPTLGMALGSELGKHFRWDIRASGMGFPHKGAIAGAEGSIAVRFGLLELVAGEKFLYFKTSPKSDLYVRDTLNGVYGGVRIAFRGKK